MLRWSLAHPAGGGACDPAVGTRARARTYTSLHTCAATVTVTAILAWVLRGLIGPGQYWYLMCGGMLLLRCVRMKTRSVPLLPVAVGRKGRCSIGAESVCENRPVAAVLRICCGSIPLLLPLSLGCGYLVVVTDGAIVMPASPPPAAQILLTERFDEGLMVLRNLLKWHLVHTRKQDSRPEWADGDGRPQGQGALRQPSGRCARSSPL